ncbi:MAG: hypothetical protein GX986_04175 [Firmicutes bacterium]|nr:hypothetical protein [Bacillota bacterium]
MVKSTAVAAESLMYHLDRVGVFDKVYPSGQTLIVMAMNLSLYTTTSI